ncbi:site-specific integrase [Alkalibacillus aidingensis]|uniref:site-specific integrase n=1 Tax=Alkalibacillus aidingensis TaxID=2747607 RepID=UPI001661401C|nr:tyrosine-type recombinase/integrase [Alkalibacillus aidingensis]
MAGAQKRGKTFQYSVSYTVNGKTEQFRKGGFRTKKEAQLAGNEMELQIKKGHLPSSTPSSPQHIDEYFEKWVELYKPNVAGSTKYNYKYTLNAIKAHFGDIPLQNLKRHDYQLFLNNFGATKSRETVEKVHSHIRACIQDAMEDEIIRHDFTRKAELTWTIKSKKPIEKHLNYNESQRLLNKLFTILDYGLEYYLILLGLTSGLRFGELVGLTTKDFDFQSNTINVEKAWGYLKRSPEGFGPTKNEQSNRIIKIDRRTMEAFKKLFRVMPSNVNQLVFFNSNSKYKVISNSTANKKLKEILKELEINPITMHGLRHTHASVLLHRDVSIDYVSERLGHSDIQTTFNKYAHLLQERRIEDERETMNIFESMVA